MVIPPFLQPWLHPVQSGWDPVSKEYAAQYENGEWQQTANIAATLDRIETWRGPLKGNRVLDLGGGPGQFSVAMALRGARVTWHDPSRNYQETTLRRAAHAGVRLTFSLGYLEEAARLASEPFDFVFNRICWLYCVNDRKFVHLIWSLVAPGGSAYIDLTNDSAERKSSRKYKMACWFNRYLGLKIAYTHPPRGLVAQLFNELGPARLQVSYERGCNDTLLLTKPVS